MFVVLRALRLTRAAELVEAAVEETLAYYAFASPFKSKSGNSVDAGITEMLDRMRGGRFKVFSGQNDVGLEEYHLYHRDKNGLIVKEGDDDAISASRYALMMVREGRADERPMPNGQETRPTKRR